MCAGRPGADTTTEGDAMNSRELDELQQLAGLLRLAASRLERAHALLRVGRDMDALAARAAGLVALAGSGPPAAGRPGAAAVTPQDEASIETKDLCSGTCGVGAEAAAAVFDPHPVDRKKIDRTLTVGANQPKSTKQIAQDRVCCVRRVVVDVNDVPF